MDELKQNGRASVIVYTEDATEAKTLRNRRMNELKTALMDKIISDDFKAAYIAPLGAEYRAGYDSLDAAYRDAVANKFVVDDSSLTREIRRVSEWIAAIKGTDLENFNRQTAGELIDKIRYQVRYVKDNEVKAYLDFVKSIEQDIYKLSKIYIYDNETIDYAVLVKLLGNVDAEGFITNRGSRGTDVISIYNIVQDEIANLLRVTEAARADQKFVEFLQKRHIPFAEKTIGLAVEYLLEKTSAESSKLAHDQGQGMLIRLLGVEDSRLSDANYAEKQAEYQTRANALQAVKDFATEQKLLDTPVGNFSEFAKSAGFDSVFKKLSLNEILFSAPISGRMSLEQVIARMNRMGAGGIFKILIALDDAIWREAANLREPPDRQQKKTSFDIGGFLRRLRDSKDASGIYLAEISGKDIRLALSERINGSEDELTRYIENNWDTLKKLFQNAGDKYEPDKAYVFSTNLKSELPKLGLPAELAETVSGLWSKTIVGQTVEMLYHVEDYIDIIKQTQMTPDLQESRVVEDYEKLLTVAQSFDDPLKIDTSLTDLRALTLEQIYRHASNIYLQKGETEALRTLNELLDLLNKPSQGEGLKNSLSLIQDTWPQSAKELIDRVDAEWHQKNGTVLGLEGMPARTFIGLTGADLNAFKNQLNYFEAQKKKEAVEIERRIRVSPNIPEAEKGNRIRTELADLDNRINKSIIETYAEMYTRQDNVVQRYMPVDSGFRLSKEIMDRLPDGAMVYVKQANSRVDQMAMNYILRGTDGTETPYISEDDLLSALRDPAHYVDPTQKITTDELKNIYEALPEEMRLGFRRYADAVENDRYLIAKRVQMQMMMADKASQAELEKVVAEYNERYNLLAEQHKELWQNANLKKFGFSDRLANAKGVLVIGMLMKVVYGAIEAYGKETDGENLQTGFEKIANFLSTYDYVSWLNNYDSATGFGALCSVRDGYIVDFTMDMLNGKRPFLNKIYQPGDMAEILSKIDGTGFRAETKAYIKNCLKYWASAGVLLFAAGFVMDGIYTALKEYEYLLTSNDYYDQQLFNSALLLTMISEGVANVAYEIPSMANGGLSLALPHLAGKTARIPVLSLLTGRLLPGFVNNPAVNAALGVVLIQVISKTLQTFWVKPEIERLTEQFQEIRQRNEELGIPPPAKLTPEQLGSVETWSRVEQAFQNTLRGISPMVLSQWMGKSAINWLTNVELTRTGISTAALGTNAAVNVITKANQITLALQVTGLLLDSLEGILSAEVAEQNMSFNMLSNLEKSVPLSRLINVDMSKGVSNLQFTLAQALYNLHIFGEVRDGEVQGSKMYDDLLAKIPDKDKSEFEKNWKEMLRGLRNNDPSLLNGWFNQGLYGGVSRFLGHFTLRYGRSGDRFGVQTSAQDANFTKAGFFEYVMANALLYLYVDNPEYFRGTAAFLTEANIYDWSFLLNGDPAKYGVNLDPKTQSCVQVNISGNYEQLPQYQLFVDKPEMYAEFMQWLFLERNNPTFGLSRSYYMGRNVPSPDINGRIRTTLIEIITQKTREYPPRTPDGIINHSNVTVLNEFFRELTAKRPQQVMINGKPIAFEIYLTPGDALKEFFNIRLFRGDGQSAVVLANNLYYDYYTQEVLTKVDQAKATATWEQFTGGQFTKYKITVDPQTKECQKVEFSGWFLAARSVAQLPQYQLFVDKPEMYVDFMQWLILERGRSPFAYAQGGTYDRAWELLAKETAKILELYPPHNSDGVLNRANIARLTEFFKEIARGHFTLTLEDGKNETLVYYMFDDVNKALQDFFNFRLRQTGAFTVRDEQTSRDRLDRSLSMANAENSKQFINDVSLAIALLGGADDKTTAQAAAEFARLRTANPAAYDRINKLKDYLRRPQFNESVRWEIYQYLNGKLPGTFAYRLLSGEKVNLDEIVLGNFVASTDFAGAPVEYIRENQPDRVQAFAGLLKDNPSIESAIRFFAAQHGVAFDVDVQNGQRVVRPLAYTDYQKILNKMVQMGLAQTSDPLPKVLNVLNLYQTAASFVQNIITNNSITDKKAKLAEQIILLSANSDVDLDFNNDLITYMFSLLPPKEIVPTERELQIYRLPKGDLGEENLDAFLVQQGIVSAAAVKNNQWSDARGKYGATIDCLSSGIESFVREHPDQIDSLTENLITIYQTLNENDNHKYRWKVEALILGSPTLLKALLDPKKGYGWIVETATQNRLEYSDPQYFQRSIQTLYREAGANSFSEIKVYADILQYLRERSSKSALSILEANLTVEVDTTLVVSSPEFKAVAESPLRTSYYTVSSGDTLSGIARRHNISLQMLYRLNPTFDPTNGFDATKLQIGTKLVVPIALNSDV
jgi:LysM repeat protein